MHIHACVDMSMHIHACVQMDPFICLSLHLYRQLYSYFCSVTRTCQGLQISHRHRVGSRRLRRHAHVYACVHTQVYARSVAVQVAQIGGGVLMSLHEPIHMSLHMHVLHRCRKTFNIEAGIHISMHVCLHVSESMSFHSLCRCTNRC